MKIFLIVLGSVIGFLLLLFIVIGSIAYIKIYKREKGPYDVLTVPDEEFPFPHSVKESCAEIRKIPYEELYIDSPRGYKLYGELRKAKDPYSKEKPTVILFLHGFKSAGDNDLALYSGFQLKHYDVLIIDHDGCGKSGGKRCGFGVYEQENTKLWVEKINEIYNHNVNIFLHGVSMGSNTALLSADKEMENVCGIIGDCGYVSTYKFLHHLVKLHILALMAVLFNSMAIHKNIFKYSTIKSLKSSRYPILLIHGKKDELVPSYMSSLNDEACSSKHELVLFDKATHAMSYLTDPEKYEKIFDAFILENKQGDN